MIPLIEPKYPKTTAKALERYLASGDRGSEYKETRTFEQEIADYLGVKYCFAVPNGTIALIIAMAMADVESHCEVIVPSISMVATAIAPKFLGAKLCYANIDKTGCMDIDDTIYRITPLTKAIIYVALNGRCNNITKLKRICKKKNILLVEDACQAFGSKYEGKYIGTFGDIGCLSFSPHKIISTGQGGALITNNKELAERIRCYKDFGREHSGADWHEHFGINAKFTDFQAVIGRQQLKTLDKRIARKKEIYQSYYDKLQDIMELKFVPTDLKQTTPWMVDALVDWHMDLQSHLKEKGIQTRLIYPELYTQPCCAKDAFHHAAYAFAHSGIWFPSFLDITEKQIQYVCDEIRKYYG